MQPDPSSCLPRHDFRCHLPPHWQTRTSPTCSSISLATDTPKPYGVLGAYQHDKLLRNGMNEQSRGPFTSCAVTLGAHPLHRKVLSQRQVRQCCPRVVEVRESNHHRVRLHHPESRRLRNIDISQSEPNPPWTTRSRL